MSPRERKPADPRHGLFRTLLEAYWRDERNEHVPDLPWGPGEAGALGAFLRANPRISAEGFNRLLLNRLNSDDHARAESPKVWLSSLTRYANGPLDRYKLPKAAAGASEATVGMPRATETPQADDSAALSYWRIVRQQNRLKFEREVPLYIRVQLAEESL